MSAEIAGLVLDRNGGFRPIMDKIVEREEVVVLREGKNIASRLKSIKEIPSEFFRALYNTELDSKLLERFGHSIVKH